MAIDRGTARLILSEHAKRPLRGSILQLGRQTILFNEKQLRVWSLQAGANLKERDESAHLNGRHKDNFAVYNLDDIDFFRLLGFDEVSSCDLSSYESATFQVDLNVPVVPELHDRFDVIFDGGTMEHVFNLPAVLGNIHAMLKVGGRVIHVAPSSNMIDHGFYSFSPTLFSDYYRANKYALLSLNLFEFVSWASQWTVYDCLSGALDNRLGRTANSKMAGVFCVAEKTSASTSSVVPVQTHFASLWDTPHRGERNKWAAAREVIKDKWPKMADALYWARSVAWRMPAWRRAAMPPLLGKY